jgi:Radical SAM superfamily
MALHYDVEADWTLLTSCNYRCSYCFYSPEKLSTPLQIHASTEQWADGFDSTGKTWLIHITGGEPTIYPGFVNLCRNLSQKHYISFNSNLSGNCCEAFMETIDPQRVSFVHAALHYEEREKKKSLDLFIRRVQNFRLSGFNVMLTIVMTPDVIRLYPEISARLAPHGLSCIPKIMRGRTWNGNKYPEAYTEVEKMLFRRYLTAAARSYEQSSAAVQNLQP